MSGPTSGTGPGPAAERGGARAEAIGHLVFNASLAAVFVWLYVRAGDLPSSMWEPLGAGSFPRLMLAAMIALNGALIIQQGLRLARTSPLATGAVTGWLWRHRLAFIVLILFAGFVLAMPWVGYRWAALVFIAVTQVVLGARGLRALIVAAVIAWAFSFGLADLFGTVFHIMLPPPAWQ